MRYYRGDLLDCFRDLHMPCLAQGVMVFFTFNGLIWKACPPVLAVGLEAVLKIRSERCSGEYPVGVNPPALLPTVQEPARRFCVVQACSNVEQVRTITHCQLAACSALAGITQVVNDLSSDST